MITNTGDSLPVGILQSLHRAFFRAHGHIKVLYYTTEQAYICAMIKTYGYDASLFDVDV